MSRFPGFGRHIANPRTPAQERVNNTGGASQDTNGAALAAATSALLSAGLVRVATVTGPVGSAGQVGLTVVLGSGTATVYALSTLGTTPVVVGTANQTIRNPHVGVSYLPGAIVSVVYTGQFYLIVSPPDAGVTLASLIPVPPIVTGSRAANAALADLLTELDTLGIVDDQTTV